MLASNSSSPGFSVFPVPTRNPLSSLWKKFSYSCGIICLTLSSRLTKSKWFFSKMLISCFTCSLTPILRCHWAFFLREPFYWMCQVRNVKWGHHFNLGWKAGHVLYRGKLLNAVVCNAYVRQIQMIWDPYDSMIYFFKKDIILFSLEISLKS